MSTEEEKISQKKDSDDKQENVDKVQDSGGEPEKKEVVEVEKEEYEKLLNAKKIADEEVKRARADALNFRKRVEKEKQSFIEFSSGNVLSKLLPVSDDLKRLIENGKDDIPETHYNAIVAIEQRINDIYASEGVGLIKIKKGKTAFDPNRHQAVFALPTEEYPPNIVVDITSSGFIKGDRVLRPAKVVISKAVEKPAESKEDKSNDKSTDSNEKTEGSKSSAEDKKSEGEQNEPVKEEK